MRFHLLLLDPLCLLQRKIPHQTRSCQVKTGNLQNFVSTLGPHILSAVAIGSLSPSLSLPCHGIALSNPFVRSPASEAGSTLVAVSSPQSS